jgi:blue copper oxidase
VKRRRFVLGMGMGGMASGGMMGGGMAMTINGRAFDMARIDERVRLGDTEIWEVSGETMAHPAGLHQRGRRARILAGCMLTARRSTPRI